MDAGILVYPDEGFPALSHAKQPCLTCEANPCGASELHGSGGCLLPVKPRKYVACTFVPANQRPFQTLTSETSVTSLLPSPVGVGMVVGPGVEPGKQGPVPCLTVHPARVRVVR